jgi:hypothetical protein
MLARKNLESFTRGAAVCREELIPAKVQIRAAIKLEVWETMSMVAEGDAF